ncbi:MAG: DEAD/DEAH box helicase [Methylosarcina sp.]
MKAIVRDRVYLPELSHEQSRLIKKRLTFNNPKFHEAIKFGRGAYGIERNVKLFEEVGSRLIIPRGVSLGSLGLVPDKTEDKRHVHPITIKTNIEPRSYQERSVRLAFEAGSGVIVAPTGAGKTTMGIELASRLAQRCLVLVKSLDLARQWQDAIKRFTGLECGLIGDGQWQEGEEFTVATVQTLIKHQKSLNYGMVSVDECHNVPAEQAYQVINRQAAKYRYGLSATPQRHDNLEMMIHAALGPIVAEIQKEDVGGAVLPVTVSTIEYGFQGNPDSWQEFINQLAENPKRNQLIVSRAIKSSQTIGTAVLTGTVEHSERLHGMMASRGIDALLLHGQLPKKIRSESMAVATDHQLIVGTLSLLSEEIDWPHIGAAIFASPVSAAVDKATPAATRLIQSIGRARRPFPGKRRAFVLDIIDNHPFGKASFKKRSVIYRQQGFEVHNLSHKAIQTGKPCPTL